MAREYFIKYAEMVPGHGIHRRWKVGIKLIEKSAADKLADWIEANLPDMECRSDEDCDHCVGLQILKEYRGEK